MARMHDELYKCRWPYRQPDITMPLLPFRRASLKGALLLPIEPQTRRCSPPFRTRFSPPRARHARSPRRSRSRER
eukprot:2442708-Pleurochrysis_carterae.AAC.1